MAKAKRKECPHCGEDKAANYIAEHIKRVHPDEFDPNPAHRPSGYDPKYIDKVDEYLSDEVDKEVKFVKQKNEEKGYEMYGHNLKVQLPTIKGFAKFIDVPSSTLYDWRDKHEKFSEALTRIKDEQWERLVNKGLAGVYNSKIVDRMLSGNHGLKDRKDITSKGQKMSLTELAKAAEEDE